MRIAPVLKEKNSLPRPKLQLAVDDGNRLARPRQDHPDVRWHVVTAFIRMFEIWRGFRHEFVEKLFQIAPRRRCRIFHRRQTAAGVLNKNRHRPAAHTRSIDLRPNIIGNFVCAFAPGLNFEPAMMNRHGFG